MQIINNTNGLFENIYFKDTTIDKSIKNHKELLEVIIPKCNKVLIASPFLMNDFKQFFASIDIKNIKFELITTCNPKGAEQLTKPFQIMNFGLTIKEHTTKWSDIHLISSLHSKIYLFYKNDSIVLGVVTSANFTNNGLSCNHETGVVLSDNKILNDLEVDIRNNLEYIKLSESQVNDLCREADLKKKDKKLEKQEDIDINISRYLQKNNTQCVEDDRQIQNDNDILIDKNKEFDFEKFITKLITKNNKVETINVSNLDINIIPTNIHKLTELKNINMNNNNITVLPDEFFSLNKLETLDISDNKINHINSNIQKSQNLKTLKINDNASLNISSQIFKLKNLRKIITDKNIIDMNIEIFQKIIEDNLKITDKNDIDLTEYIKKYTIKEFIICIECNEEKERISFETSRMHKKSNYKTGVCRDCVKKAKNKRDKDLVPIIRERYRNLKQKAGKNKKELNFEVEELISKFKDNNNFKQLYSEWDNSLIKGERDKDLKPNFYLINEDSLDFSLENIKITTSAEINKKNAQNISDRYSETTIQFTLGNELIQIYKSTQEVAKKFGTADNNISNCCNEENKKTNKAIGYIWKYLKNIKDKAILDKLEKIKKVNQCYIDDEDFLLELVNNKDLKDYLKIILYFKDYEDQELKEKIQDSLLSNTNGYLLELFKKDSFELIEEFKHNYSKIETKYFDYLYGFINIRYSEDEDISIIKIIAKNSTSKQLIEFLMEYKTNQKILISIIENDRKEQNNQFIVSLEILKRVLEYSIKLNNISIAKKVISRKEITRELIDKAMLKFDNEALKDILLNTNYSDRKVNKRIHNKFGNTKNKKEDITNIKSQKETYAKSRENNDTLKKWLIELRDNDISKKFIINERCILSDIMIEQFLDFKPIDKKDFTTNISFKFRDNIEPEQMIYIYEIFEILEMANE